MIKAEPSKTVRRSPLKAMLGTSSAILGASLLAVSLAGGTYGLWADSAPIDAGIVTAGDLTLTVNTSSISPAAWSTMFPGDRVRQSVTLTNAGDVAADVTVIGNSTATYASSYTVRVAKGACVSALGGGNVVGSNTAIGTWLAGEAATVCIDVQLNTDAANLAQNQAVPFTLVFTATQKAA